MDERLRRFGGDALKIIGGVGVVFSVVLGYRQCASEGKLHATIVANQFGSPPTEVRQSANKDTAQATPTTLSFDKLDPLSSYLNVRIVNEGRREVKQVFLRVPNGTYACLLLESAAGWKCHKPAEVIAIGDLQGSESARVLVWQSFSASLKDIRLTYSEGVGKISFETIDVPRGFLREVAIPLALLAVLALIVVWFITADAAQDRQRALERELKQREHEALERKRAEIQAEL